MNQKYVSVDDECSGMGENKNGHAYTCEQPIHPFFLPQMEL